MLKDKSVFIRDSKGRFMKENIARAGAILSLEIRKKISKSRIGQHNSPKTEFKERVIPWNKKFNLTKEELSCLYWEKRMSLAKIAKMLKMHKKTILYWFNKNNLPTRKFSPLEARMEAKPRISNTKPECILREICEKHRLPLRYTGDRKFWIANMNPDFIHNKKKIAVEVFGDYWHLKRQNIPYAQTYDGRREILAKHGWKLIVFWESELKSSYVEEIVLERLVTL